MKALDIAETKIIEREGFRDRVYKDTRGNLTAGYGHFVQPKDGLKEGDGISRDLAETWLDQDLSRSYKNACQQGLELGKTTPEFIAALTCANYQLGDFKFKFPTTFNLLKQGAWQAAISNILNSNWNRQTPVRADDFIIAIRAAYAPKTIFNKISTLIKGVLA